MTESMTTAWPPSTARTLLMHTLTPMSPAAMITVSGPACAGHPADRQPGRGLCADESPGLAVRPYVGCGLSGAAAGRHRPHRGGTRIPGLRPLPLPHPGPPAEDHGRAEGPVGESAARAR